MNKLLIVSVLCVGAALILIAAKSEDSSMPPGTSPEQWIPLNENVGFKIIDLKGPSKDRPTLEEIEKVIAERGKTMKNEEKLILMDQYQQRLVGKASGYMYLRKNGIWYKTSIPVSQSPAVIFK